MTTKIYQLKLKRKKRLKNILFAVAAIIVWTPLLHPIHEWGHLLFAGTANAKIISWSETYLRNLTYHGLMGGFWTQLALGILLFIITRKHWPLQGFGLGYISSTFVFAFLSKDFENLMQMGMKPITVAGLWILVSGPILVIMWGITAFKMRKEKEEESAHERKKVRIVLLPKEEKCDRQQHY